MVTVSGNSNPTNPTYPTNPTNPTTINSGELTDKNQRLHYDRYPNSKANISLTLHDNLEIADVLN